MKRLFTTIAAALALACMAGAASADAYRVSYTCRGSGKQITVQAKSSQEARNTVKDLFPACYVTGARRIGR